MLITVCASCLQASCWQGVFMCQESLTAGTVEKTVDELQALKLEHPDWWVIEPDTGCSHLAAMHPSSRRKVVKVSR